MAPPSPSPFERSVISSFYNGTNTLSEHDAEQESSTAARSLSRKEGSADIQSRDLDPLPIDPSACKVVGQITASELFVHGDQRRLLDQFRAMVQASSSTGTQAKPIGVQTMNYADYSSHAAQAYQEVRHVQADQTSSNTSASNRTSTTYSGTGDDESTRSDPSFVTRLKSDSSQVHDRWDDRFEELRRFVRQNGHCHVPTRLESNPSLARWCKRQRYQHKLKQAGDHSTLTDEREQQLDDIEFVWDAHTSSWEERFMELVEFKNKNGHTSVPRSKGKLGSWVKSQRRQHALYIRGLKTHLTPNRVAKINSLGFQWVGSKSPFPKESGYNGDSSSG